MTHEPRERDGTSQAGRSLAALEPGHVAVDERTLEDLIAYVHAYAQGLVYHGPDDMPVKGIGLGGLVGQLSPAKVAAFIRDPERFDPDSDPDLFRPHFVLLLVFLKLLERAREQLNTLTARHLEFYYRDVLRMTRRRPVADRVNVVFTLAKGEREVMVPAGTPLAAGADSLGKDRVYTTDRDFVVNRARIAGVRSVFVDRRVTGLKDARTRARTDEEADLWMLRLALGEPRPGDPLPLYPDGRPVTAEKLKQLDALTQSASDVLSLNELRELMHRRDIARALTGQTQATAWAAIAAIIEGARRRTDPAYRLPSKHDPTNFAATLDAALGPGSADALEDTWAKLRELEDYFFVDAESFHRIVQQFRERDETAWNHVDALLDAAHKAKVRAVRRRRLKQVGEGAELAVRLARLVHEVMADPAATLDDLAPFCPDLRSLTSAAEEGDWGRVHGILEVAQRNRIGEPPAQQEEWLNLYPAVDAPTAGARASLPGSDESPRWAAFGLRPEASRDVAPAPVLGWAVSSPLLVLREGTRTITLTLGLRAGEVGPARLAELLASTPSPLRVELSTAEGWVLCQSELSSETLPMDQDDPRAADLRLRLAMTVEADAAPLAAMPAALADVDSPWPTLRLMLQPVWSEDLRRYRVPYRELAVVVVVAARLAVAVTGIRALTLQSDESELNPRKPFEPFGSSPAVGSRLLLGHPEIVDKRLDALSFHFQWMKPPADLKAHYRNYGLGDFEFTTRISVVDRDRPTELATAGLFDAQDTGAPTTIAVPSPVPAPRPGAGGEPGDDLSTWPRCFQWELNAPDFQHSAHAEVMTRKADELAAAIANAEVTTGKANELAAAIASAPKPLDPAHIEFTTRKANELAAAIADRGTVDARDYAVKPPYTPKLKVLTINYAASQEIALDSLERDGMVARVYHLHPFGACTVEAERSPRGLPLLPRHDADGELQLGLSDVAAPQSVSILFQLAEGSAEPDSAPQRVTWSYLSGDRWLPLDGRVVQDTTGGFSNTGIVELALPPAAPSTRVRGGLYWIRAAVARDTASVCDVIALHTQAISATFADHDNAPDHFREPLPPSTIAGLAADIPEIGAVHQPFTSYGGRPAEEGDRWTTRVSERLRHRQRALSTWDYERLVLDRFPEIYKAKCVPARPDAPGEVRVIVIPDVHRLTPADPFAPKAPARLLADIESHLRTRTPAFVRVSVTNPHYVAVRVRVRVRFVKGIDEGYHARRLHEELVRFLSPWAYKEGGDIALGGRIYANSILDFLDRRPYVDYVAGLLLLRSEDGERFTPVDPPPEDEGEFVAAGRPDAVLVAARTHIIDVLHDAMHEDHLTTGVHFMRVELDFIVT